MARVIVSSSLDSETDAKLTEIAKLFNTTKGKLIKEYVGAMVNEFYGLFADDGKLTAFGVTSRLGGGSVREILAEKFKAATNEIEKAEKIAKRRGKNEKAGA